MIRFACPSCSAVMSVTDEKAGKTGKCPKCQAAFLIPVPESGPRALDAEPIPPPSPPQVRVTPVAPSPAPAAAVEINPCPGCQGKLTVAASSLGVDVSCPYCQTVFRAVKAGVVEVPSVPVPPIRVRTDDTDFPKTRRVEDDDDDDRPARRNRRRRDDDEDDDDPPPPPRRSRRTIRTDGPRRSGMVRIARVDLASSVKWGAAMGLTYGLFYSAIFGCLFAVMGATAPRGAAVGPMLSVGIIPLIITPIISAIGGAIGGVIWGIIYNVWAGMIGGFEVELE